MMPLNGMTSYILLPNWWLIFFLEVATVIIEVAIITAYWFLRKGKLRWYEIVGIVAIANLVTAAIGVAAGEMVMGQNDIYHYSSVEPSALLTPIVITIVFVGVILALVSTRWAEQPQETTNHEA